VVHGAGGGVAGVADDADEAGGGVELVEHAHVLAVLGRLVADGLEGAGLLAGGFDVAPEGGVDEVAGAHEEVEVAEERGFFGGVLLLVGVEGAERLRDHRDKPPREAAFAFEDYSRVAVELVHDPGGAGLGAADDEDFGEAGEELVGQVGAAAEVFNVHGSPVG
jgi:hypothetical protein